MKSAIPLLLAAIAVTAQNVEWNECQETCLEEGGNSACTQAWEGTPPPKPQSAALMSRNETECFCSTEQFAADVRHCFYENSCWTDIMPFYEAREARCGDLAEDVSFEGRPGAGVGNTTSSASSTGSASVSESASASTTSAQTSGAVSPGASVSSISSEASVASASSEPAASDNAAAASLPGWGSDLLAMGSMVVLGVVSGGLLL